MNSFAFNIVDLEIGYKQTGRFKTLSEPFSIDIKKSSLIAVIGSNGTGKSTFLNSLANDLEYRGSVNVFGHQLSKISERKRAKLMASISTHYQVQAYTKVFDVISKGRTVHTGWLGRLRIDDKNIIKASASKVGVEHLLDRFFDTLSDGEQQRVMIAMLLAQQSDILLLDEPTAFVDYANKYYITSLLKDLATEGKTVIFSSHDLDVVKCFADEIIFLNEQKVELISKPNFYKLDKLTELFKNKIPDDFKDNLIQNLMR